MRGQAEELSKQEPLKVVRSDGDHKQPFANAATRVEAIVLLSGHIAFALGADELHGGFPRRQGGDLGADTESRSRTRPGCQGARHRARCCHHPRDTLRRRLGRRLAGDFMVQSAAIAKMAGAPVKLLWDRRQDLQHDMYRPAGYHHFSAGVDARGKLVTLRDHFVTFGVGDKFNQSATFSATEYPARLIPNIELAMSSMPFSQATGPMRAPGSNGLAYAFQSFLDEVAFAAKRDPVDFNLEILGEPRAIPTPAGPNGPLPPYDTGRMRSVIEAVREKSGWKQAGLHALARQGGHDGAGSAAARTGMGFACYYCHQGYFAEVVKATVDAQGAVKVDKIWVAADVGSPIVNPSGAVNQVQGAVLDGIGQALGLAINIENGQATATNFHEFPLLRMYQAAPVEVHFLPTNFPPTGLGEPALPPVLPALVNAVFAATGQRVRKLPIKGAELKTA